MLYLLSGFSYNGPQHIKIQLIFLKYLLRYGIKIIREVVGKNRRQVQCLALTAINAINFIADSLGKLFQCFSDFSIGTFNTYRYISNIYLPGFTKSLQRVKYARVICKSQ